MKMARINNDSTDYEREYIFNGTTKYNPIYDNNNNMQRGNTQDDLSFKKYRSTSSSFRRSIRRLTSCAAARRKPGHNSASTKASLTTGEISCGYDDEQRRHSVKGHNTSRKYSPSGKQSNNYSKLTMKSVNNSDVPPALPPRKPLDRKISAQKASNISKPSISTNPFQTSTDTLDDKLSSSPLLTTSRILPNKEISTSLVNLMGTASDSIGVDNKTQPPVQQTPRIAAAPANALDRLSLVAAMPNTSVTESPSFHRTISEENAKGIGCTKVSKEPTWCYESFNPAPVNITTSFDECLPKLEIDDKPLTYRQQFESTEHFNWYGNSESCGPVIISYKHSIDQNKQRSIVSIVRTRQKTFIERIFDIPSATMPNEILRRICEQCGIPDIEHFDPVLCDGTHDLLLKYDESLVSNQHKFGVIYQCENQTTEEDIFSNETHSVAMENFLKLIGQRVKLKDFQGFRGGLDVKSDQTGTETVYEQFHEHEIMFHVSTLLPHSKSERQQLERKRHIGNDIVAIVFQQTETPFNPECITSQFLHVYIVVTPLDADGASFKVSVMQRESVPSFGPKLIQSKIFRCDQLFKQWLLTKLINAEMASCRASTFQKYQERTKKSLFDNLYCTLHNNNRPLMNFILTHSQYKHECDVEQHEKEEIPMNSTVKTPDRHGDSSLLSSVRRRFIAPKLLRVQHSTPVDNGKSPLGTSIVVTPPSVNTNDSRNKSRITPNDLRRSTSRESMMTNGNSTVNGNGTGKVSNLLSSAKTSSPRLDNSIANRSLVDSDNVDSSNLQANKKIFSPPTCPSIPYTNGSSNGCVTSSSDEHDQCGDSHSNPTPNINKIFNVNSSTDDTDNDVSIQSLPHFLQSSSREDLVKYIVMLQQQLTKVVQPNHIHSNTVKQINTDLLQRQNVVVQQSP